jgi:RNA polymerase sigma-70 factor, ECF subfamily
VAVAMATGPDAALPALDELVGHPALGESHRVWAVRADLNRRAGHTVAALADYDRALDLVRNDAERQYLVGARQQAEQESAETSIQKRG